MTTECSPQIEDGYTKIAHELLEAITPQMAAPWAVFFAVMRMAYGYSKKSAEITYDKLMQLTGIAHRPNICRAIKQAESMGIIDVIRSDNRKPLTFSINKRYRTWKPVIKTDNIIKTDNELLSNHVEKPLPTIRVKKERNTPQPFSPPTGEQLRANGHAWIDATAWDNFMSHRKSLGKKGKLSEVSVKLLLKKCEMVKVDHVEMINASIESNWTGLFPDKFLKKGQRPGNQEPRKRKLLTPQGEPT
jgi:phage replication O-like protein O